MTKAPDAFRTISEVAEELDLPQHVLRFWETRFNQIKPLKRGGGRRYYRPDDINLLRGIRHLLYGEGYTIKGVQRIFKEQGVRHVMAIWQEQEHRSDVPDAKQDEQRVAATNTIRTARAVEQAAPDTLGNAQATTAAANPEQHVSPKTLGPVVPSPAIAQNVVSKSGESPTHIQQAPVVPSDVVFNADPVVLSQQHDARVLKPNATVNTPDVIESIRQKPVDKEPPKQPFFKLAPAIPNHLIKAVFRSEDADQHAQNSIEERAQKASPGEVAARAHAATLPRDILSDDGMGEPAKGQEMSSHSLLSRLAGIAGIEQATTEEGHKKQLTEEEVQHLQGTLVELLECKRLLDQIR